jgi:hypothetical protein
MLLHPEDSRCLNVHGETSTGYGRVASIDPQCEAVVKTSPAGVITEASRAMQENSHSYQPKKLRPHAAHANFRTSPQRVSAWLR